MPSSSSARMTRTAISPRLATRTFANIGRGMLSARLVLVRHGQSVWNADGLLQGQADPPLSPAGRAEAAALAPYLRGFPADRVRSSDLRRAVETAALAGHADPVLDPRLREIDVGEWAGRPLAELPRGSEVSWRAGP